MTAAKTSSSRAEQFCIQRHRRGEYEPDQQIESGRGDRRIGLEERLRLGPHRRQVGEQGELVGAQQPAQVQGPAAILGRDRLWSFSTRAARVYTEATYRTGDALIFGPESRGLPLSWLDERPDRAVRIPIRPEARSLNLANAVAIGLFEAVRQVGGPDPGPKARD